jgi:hypothetical protein
VDNFDVNTIVTTIEMLLEQSRTTRIIVVEGESDRAFLEAQFPTEFDEDTLIQPADNRYNALAVFRAVESSRVSAGRVLVMVDADLDRLMGGLLSHEALVYSDYRDLETSLLSLEEVRQRWVASMFGIPQAAAQKMFNAAVAIELARSRFAHANERFHLGLPVHKVEARHWACERKGPDEGRFADELIRRMGSSTSIGSVDLVEKLVVAEAAVAVAISELLADEAWPHRVHGHCLCQTLHWLASVWPDRRHRKVISIDAVERALLGVASGSPAGRLPMVRRIAEWIGLRSSTAGGPGSLRGNPAD